MAYYDIDLPDVGTVRVTKKRGMKSIRLRVAADGTIAVSAPWYVPKLQLMTFLRDKHEWMLAHQVKRALTPYDGMGFGRDMTLRIHEYSVKQRSRLGATTLDVYVVAAYDPNNRTQLELLTKAMQRALKREAEEQLLPRLHELSLETGIEFNQAYVKHLTGRWGSCDQSKNILLSTFLVQLPQNLIDYVIIHELSHTKHLNHSAAFWLQVAEHCPNYKVKRLALKQYEPRIIERK